METLKICILAPEFIPCWGGVGTYTANLVKELKNYEVHVITPIRGNNYNKENIEKELGITIHNLTVAKDSFFYNFKFQIALLFKFWKINKEEKFDLIHSMNLVHMPDIWLKFFKSYRKILHIVTIHTLIETQLEATNLSKQKRSFSELMSLIFYPFIKSLQKYYIKHSNNFITVSNFYAKKIKELYNLNVIVIHNSVDSKTFFKTDKKSCLEKFPELKNKKNIVLYVGRFLAQKGIFDLIKAIKGLDVTLVLVGQKEKIDNAICLGFINNSDLRYIYSISDLFVLPSYYENCPMSILEALNCECKVIGSNVGGIPELINEEYLFEAGNVKQLREKIKETLDKPYSFKTLNSEKMAKETLKVYTQILKTK